MIDETHLTVMAFETGGTSLINWLERIGGHRAALEDGRRYDHQKTERLEYLYGKIGLPIGVTHYIPGERFDIGTPMMKKIIKERGRPSSLHSFRISPNEKSAGKFENIKKYGLTFGEFHNFFKVFSFKKNAIVRVTNWRPKLKYACVFVVNKDGVVGEFVRGGTLYSLTYSSALPRGKKIFPFYACEGEAVKVVGGTAQDKKEVTRILSYLKVIKTSDRAALVRKGFSFSPSRICGYYEYVEGENGDGAFTDMNNKIIATNIDVASTIAFLSGQKRSTAVLRGLVSCRATDSVEGIVQIVDEKNINAFRKGNILVCATTTVDYLPAVRNAKAIITNDGGIMSHPSIISRELNIPAIVGTKYATSKLKNGMRVRMDFSAGTIEIENGKLKS